MAIDSSEDARSIRVGIVLNSQFLPHQDPREQLQALVEQVRLARESGLSSIWVVHHYLMEPFAMLQPWPLLGRLAAESGDMTIGTSVFQLPLANPVEVAELVASLDTICGGRFIFGVGLGFRRNEFDAFGISMRDRVSRLEESMDVMRQLWTRRDVDFRGQHFRVSNASLLIAPVQRPHPPIWLGASSDAGVLRAAKHHLPWLVGPIPTINTMERQFALYEGEYPSGGAPSERPVFRELSIGPTYSKAVDQAAPFLMQKYASYAAWGSDALVTDEPPLSPEFEDLAKDRFVLGDSCQVRDELERYVHRTGASHFLLRMQWPGMKHRTVMDQIQLLGDKVLGLL